MLKSIKSTIDQDKVKQKLYERFIEPTTKGYKDFVGVEIEIPILNLEKKAVDFPTVHKVTQEFLQQFTQFKTNMTDHNSNASSLIDENTGDIVSYDCSYNNLEFSLGKETSLINVYERFRQYYTFFKETFEKYNHTLTGMGVNPYRKYNIHEPIPSERYQMLYHHLSSYTNYSDLPKYFHPYPEYGMFSSASQIQLDVEKDNLIETINTFTKLEPLKAVLFSNSILLEDNEDLICCRDMFWQDSTHGINLHNIGMYETELESVNDLRKYIESLNIYCTMRDGFYINFPTINIIDYFNQEKIQGEYCEKGKYYKTEFTPELDDIEYLRSFKFLDLTYRGTIEYRSACAQPIRDVMTVSAFQLGLKHNLDKLKQLLDDDEVIYHQGYTASELRKLFCQRKLPSFVDEEKLYNLLEQILDLSKEGLEKRGYGEEKFLSPLYDRIEKHSNPALDLLNGLESGRSIEEFIEEYGTL